MVMTLADASDSQAWASRGAVSSSGLTMNIVQSLRGVAIMLAALGMLSDGDVGSASGGFGVTLNMGTFSSKGHNHLATKRKGGSRAQVSRPVKFPKTRRTRRCHAHSHHKLQADA
ncbi:hypothetical protein D3C84_1112010 [compost metagenome]